MPDNVTLPGTGSVVEAVEVGGALRQVVQVANLPDTQPVSATALPLPTGAATEATAAALLTAAQAIKTAAETLAGRTINTGAVSGTVALDGPTLAALEAISADTGLAQPLTDAQLRASAVPVSAAALPLPTGAATEATLAAVQTLLATLNGTVGVHNAPFVDGAPGQVMLAKRRDSDSTTVADGYLNTLHMDEEGRLKVASKPASYAATVGNVTSATSTVVVNTERFSNLMIHCAGTFAGANCTFEGSLNSTNGTDGNWFAVQAIRSNANTIETTTGVLGAAPAYAWELSVNAMKWFRIRATAWTSGTQTWTMIPGTYATEPIPGAQISGTQPVSGTVTATVTGGTVLPVTPTTLFTNSAATTNATLVKSTAGTLWSIAVSNTNAAARFLKLFNLTTAPTVGTSVPVFTVAIPSGGTVLVNGGSNGIRFATGISLAITGAAGDLDTTAIGAGDVKVATTYT